MAGPPPEDPTRRLAPASPPPLPPSGRGPLPPEYAYVEGDPETSRGALLDELRALKRWLAVVGAIALVGLGISLYTLLSDEEDGDGRGASRTSVRQLDNRVDELENDLRERATKNSVDSLREDQEALDTRVDEVSDQAEGGADADAVSDLRSQIEELEGRVEAAEQQGDTGGEAAPDDEQGGTGSP
jgi:outer membrane murein-binding lipoprotein Lpp